MRIYPKLILLLGIASAVVLLGESSDTTSTTGSTCGSTRVPATSLPQKLPAV